MDLFEQPAGSGSSAYLELDLDLDLGVSQLPGFELASSDALSFPASYFDASFLEASTPFQPIASTSALPPTGTAAAAAAKPQDSGPTKRVKSCQACRLRRVKTKNTKMRTGKRIEAARNAYGGDATAPPSVLRAPSASATSTALTSTQPSTAIVSQPPMEVIGSQAITPTSTTSRLATKEIQGAMISSLIDLYLTTSPTIALVEDTKFRLNFELSGRRLDTLDDQSQVLCSVLMAAGARSSDHPLLIGGNGPKMSELGVAAKLGVDLREYGARREAACQTLLNRAIDLMDEKGILHLKKPKLESVAALLLLEPLIQQHDTTHSEARPFVNIANGYARTLLEEGALTPNSGELKLRDSVLGWTVFLRECHRSAHTGRAPYFNEDDLVLLRDHRIASLSLEVAVHLPTVHTREFYFYQLEIWMQDMAELARVTSARLTGMRARMEPRVDEAFVEHYITKLDLCQRVAVLLNEHAPAIAAEASEPLGMDYRSVLRSLEMTLCQQALLLNHVVGQRIMDRWENSNSNTSLRSGDPVGDAAYYDRLVNIRKETFNRAFAAARRLAAIIGDAVESNVPIGTPRWSDMRASQMLFTKLPMWLSMIIDTPTTEDGGPPGFSHDTKIQDLNWVRLGLLSLGWGNEFLARQASWVETEIATVEARKRASQPQEAENLNYLELTESAPSPNSMVLAALDFVGSKDGNGGKEVLDVWSPAEGEKELFAV
ncbi:Zn(2)-C7 fungal-type transcription factor [Pseudohyphozyma bogoriensis]|nr:Zn(2)-C7 fungal-type transcription factor [Pseudohyphozyma bogoriensis]